MMAARTRTFQTEQEAMRYAAHLQLVSYEQYLGLRLRVSFLRAEGEGGYYPYWDSAYGRPEPVRIEPTAVESLLRVEGVELIDSYWNCSYAGTARERHRLLREMRGVDEDMADALSENEMMTDGPTFSIDSWIHHVAFYVTPNGGSLGGDAEVFSEDAPYVPSEQALYSFRLAFPDPRQREAILTRPPDYRVSFFERAIAAYPMRSHEDIVPYNPIDGWDGGL